MKWYSTNKKSLRVSLREAVLEGMPLDGGLYMPEVIPLVSKEWLETIQGRSYQEIAFDLSKRFFDQEIHERDLRTIVEDAFTFSSPMVSLQKGMSILELFHGPTLSFKDFGARFMARLVSHFLQEERREVYVLVATSGDTGSAVAHGFWKVPGVRVCVLYPKGKVSKLQELQMATMGENVVALEMEGSFDDCQRLVKQAFSDGSLRKEFLLTSANSINIARLIPQTFYYFYAYSQIEEFCRPLVVSVPSGNFGNLVAGLLAKKMGLPIDFFVAATNSNDVVPQYFLTGHFQAKPSKATLSNAMDVGNPSNFGRMMDLYESNLEALKKEIFTVSINDEETKQEIHRFYQENSYLLDPHTAVSLLGLRRAMEKNSWREGTGIALSTAHPAKFADVVEPLIGKAIELPPSLQEVSEKKKLSQTMSSDYEEFKKFLFSQVEG